MAAWGHGPAPSVGRVVVAAETRANDERRRPPTPLNLIHVGNLIQAWGCDRPRQPDPDASWYAGGPLGSVVGKSLIDGMVLIPAGHIFAGDKAGSHGHSLMIASRSSRQSATPSGVALSR